MLNLVSKTLTGNEKRDYYIHLKKLEALMDFFITLSPEEKKLLYKMGAVHLGYINNIFELVDKNRELLPPAFNIDEYAKDVALINDLHEMHLRMKTFFERFECTLLQLGHEAMKQSDELFSNIKQLAKKENDPALNSTVNRISDGLKQEIQKAHAPKS